jgi:ribosomal protein S18 acetylase RimI-like enzyme
MHISNNEILIKEVIVNDILTELEPMLRELHVNEQELFNQTEDWGNIASDYMNHLVDMQHNCKGCCLIAYINQFPVGFIFGYTEEQDNSRIEKYTTEQLYISDGFVKKEYRKQGIYRALNNYIENKFIELGIRRILRFTLSTNTHMQKFLEYEGYKPTRILYEKWLSTDGKNPIDLILNKPNN